MSPMVSLGCAAAWIVMLWSAVGVRRGPRPWVVQLRRSRYLPAAARNLGVTGPVGVALFAPLVIVIVGASLPISLPYRMYGAVLFCSIGWMMVAVAVMLLVSFRPPRGLVPEWLRELDERDGWQEPRRSRLEWAVVLVACPIWLLLGGAAILYGLAQGLHA